MKKTLLRVMLLCASPFFLYSQGDDCSTATYLSDVTDFCSQDLDFTNESASNGTFPIPSCWATGSNADVWFSFVATGTDVLGSVTGIAGGNGMVTPCVVLYTGTCNTTTTTMNELECATGSGVVEFYEAGLTPGVTYFIRVSSTSANTGGFRLCVNNYTPASNPGADCGGATTLCSMATVGVSQFSGGGADNTEPTGEPGTCFIGTETNSVWYTWKCGSSGPLTFDITPLNATKDIDFVLYQLAGTDPCGSRTVVRCNVSSCLNATGSTGLNMTDLDASEGPGCAGTQNAYSRYFDMVAGTSYALLINNADNISGFNLAWGESGGTIAGPVPQISISEDTICAGQSVSFDGSASTNVGGGLEWTFSNSGAPSTEAGAGPHIVAYPAAGNYIAILEGTESTGCSETESVNITVLAVPDAVISTIDPLQGDPYLVVDFHNGSSNASSYTWGFGNGQTASTTDITDHYPIQYPATGVYTVTLTASNGKCTDTDTKTVVIGYPLLEVLNVPNIITPDNDGVNDFFNIETMNAKSLKVVVLNRWGDLIKDFDGLSDKWDGKSASGNEVTEGVYYFTYTAEGFDGTKLEGHGFVEVSR